MADERTLKYAAIQYREAINEYRETFRYKVFTDEERLDLFNTQLMALNKVNEKRRILLLAAIDYDEDIIEEYRKNR